MSNEANSDFTPDRERVADANAAVPVIALGGFSRGSASERRHVIEAVKHACEHVGFFVI
jgi:isopenicillin N synthase-like dioxygenase